MSQLEVLEPENIKMQLRSGNTERLLNGRHCVMSARYSTPSRQSASRPGRVTSHSAGTGIIRSDRDTITFSSWSTAYIGGVVVGSSTRYSHAQSHTRQRRIIVDVDTAAGKRTNERGHSFIVCTFSARHSSIVGRHLVLKIKLETVSIAEPLQNRQHAPPMLSTLGSKEKREGG